MQISVHAGFRRWVVTRRVLRWQPRVVGRSLVDDPPLSGAPVGSSGRGYATSGGMEPSVQVGATLLILVPLFVLQMLVWVPLALGTIVVKAARRQPWTVVAVCEHPKPIRIEEQVVGWWASGRRAKALADDLRADRVELPT